MWRISLNVVSGERNVACLRVPSTRCWTIIRFIGVSASAISTVCSCAQLMSGTRPSVSIMCRPFRRVRERVHGVGSDWGRFGYRVVRNGQIGDQQQGGVDAARRLQLARGVLAVAVDGGGLDAETARDLFGVQVSVNEAKAFALAVGQSV